MSRIFPKALAAVSPSKGCIPVSAASKSGPNLCKGQVLVDRLHQQPLVMLLGVALFFRLLRDSVINSPSFFSTECALAVPPSCIGRASDGRRRRKAYATRKSKPYDFSAGRSSQCSTSFSSVSCLIHNLGRAAKSALAEIALFALFSNSLSKAWNALAGARSLQVGMQCAVVWLPVSRHPVLT